MIGIKGRPPVALFEDNFPSSSLCEMPRVLPGSSNDLEAIAQAIDNANRLVTIVGAGVSTSAGIPVSTFSIQSLHPD